MALHVEPFQWPTDKSEVLGKRRDLCSPSPLPFSTTPSRGLNGHAQLRQQRETLSGPFHQLCPSLPLCSHLFSFSPSRPHLSSQQPPNVFFSLTSLSHPLFLSLTLSLCVTGLPL